MVLIQQFTSSEQTFFPFVFFQFVFLLFWGWGSSYVAMLFWNLLRSPGGPQTQNPPASAES
jgi:hypothetical protein